MAYRDDGGGKGRGSSPSLFPIRPEGRLSFHALLWIIILACSWLLGGCSRDLEYPSRPITLICPWAAGGGTDRLARQLAMGLEEQLGVPVNVVNATGGGGITGHMRGALARPDGYTLTLATAELNMLHWRELTPITYRDFQPLMLVNRDDAALFVRQDAPWRSAAELAATIRENPRGLRASGTAFGGIWHLSVAGWLRSQEIPADALIWVSINGAMPSFQEMLAGRLDVVVASLPEGRALLDGGVVRALAVMSDERVAGFEEVRTLREEGMDWAMGTWRGVVMPRGVPSDRVTQIRTALERVVQAADFDEFMGGAGFAPVLLGGDEFGAMMEETDARLGAVLTGPAFATVASQQLGSMFFPAILGAALLVALVVALATGQHRRAGDNVVLRGTGWARAGVGLAWVVGYAAAWEVFGFVVSTVAALGAWLLTLGVRWTVAIPLSVAVAAGIYQAFAVWLRVPLPWGWIGW